MEAEKEQPSAALAPQSEPAPAPEPQPQPSPAEEPNLISAAFAQQEEKNTQQGLFEKAPVFSYGSAKEAISDAGMTFEELRIAKADDFPELAEGKRVSWMVEYGKVVKAISDPKGTVIRSVKEEIEQSKAFLDGLKKAKDKCSDCLVKPKVTAQSKGIAAYKAMVDELHSMGIKVIVSVWPSVDRKSENFYPMLEKGLLMRTERGALQTYDFQGDCVEIDAFNPETRKYVWEVCKRNYYDFGIDAFWLDNSEPDLGVYDFEHYRYCDGPALAISNMYPQMFSRIFYDEMSKVQETPVVNLLRCCWAGSQKYGNVVWSGDVPSTFEAFYDQLQCGLNMGLAGIPWWTTDIGGFMTDDVNDPDFRQLLIRWYQFAVYSPVLRMHGDRGPYNIPALDDRDWGGGYLHTGQPNELWSYGEENYAIMRKYYDIRVAMHDYIKSLYQEAHENGSPLLRAMFYEFPEDEKCWELQDQYMFGAKYLAAPIFQLNQFRREVYLPTGKWKLTSTGEVFEGKKTVTVEAPVEYMPVFEKL